MIKSIADSSLLVATMMLLLGCKSRAASQKIEPAPASSAAPAPLPLGTMVPSASSATPNSSASAPIEPIAPPAPAKIVASPVSLSPKISGETRCPMVLHNPRGAVIVATCESLSLLQNGELKDAPVPQTGFGVSHDTQKEGWVSQIHRVTGRWPDALVVELTRNDPYASDRGSYFLPQDAAYELVGGRWREIINAKTPQAAAWSQGRTLVFRDGQFKLLAGRKDAPLPERSPSKLNCEQWDVADFAAMADGTLVTVARSCHDAQALVVQLFEDGKPPVDFELRASLALHAKAEPRIAGDSRSALYVSIPGAKGTVLWQHNHQGFVELAVPSNRPLAAAHVTARGDLWLSFVGPSQKRGKAEPASLYRRSTAGLWQAIALPSNEVLKGFVKSADVANDVRFVPDSIASFGDGEVWLAGLVFEGVDRPVASILATAGEVTAAAPEVGARPGPDSPVAYSSDCASPFVLLYSIAQSVPADFTFPQTADALRGTDWLTSARFVEFRYKDKRTLGALVTTGESGKALVERLTAKVPGSKPQLMCFAPHSVDREVSLK